MADPRLPTPEAAWSVLLYAYHGDDAKAAEVARSLVENQPWVDHIHERAFSKWRAALEAAGKTDEAQQIDAELERIKSESTP